MYLPYVDLGRKSIIYFKSLEWSPLSAAAREPYKVLMEPVDAGVSLYLLKSMCVFMGTFTTTQYCEPEKKRGEIYR